MVQRIGRLVGSIVRGPDEGDGVHDRPTVDVVLRRLDLHFKEARVVQRRQAERRLRVVARDEAVDALRTVQLCTHTIAPTMDSAVVAVI